MTPETAEDAPDSSGHRRNRPASHTCGGCDARWTSLRVAHCSACHRTFGGVSGFDLHRTQDGESGACPDPSTLVTAAGDPRLVRGADGVWRWPPMADAVRERLRSGTLTG